MNVRVKLFLFGKVLLLINYYVSTLLNYDFIVCNENLDVNDLLTLFSYHVLPAVIVTIIYLSTPSVIETERRVTYKMGDYYCYMAALSVFQQIFLSCSLIFYNASKLDSCIDANVIIPAIIFLIVTIITIILEIIIIIMTKDTRKVRDNINEMVEYFTIKIDK
jgi:hypothetical protein